MAQNVMIKQTKEEKEAWTSDTNALYGTFARLKHPPSICLYVAGVTVSNISAM